MGNKVQIVVKDILDKEWEEIFYGMRFSHEEDITIISGSIEDDSQLHGLLNKIRDLNLKLISVNRFAQNGEQPG